MEPVKTLPGTGIPAEGKGAETAKKLFDGLFAGGGLVLSQVASLAEIELYSIQNWVRRGYVSPPKGKKYNRRQVCRLILINLLKDALPIGEVVFLLSSINGDLADESDDTIEDDKLYFYFLDMLSVVGGEEDADLEKAAAFAAKDYREPEKGAKNRLIAVLRIFYCAYRASQYCRRALALTGNLKNAPDRKS